MGDDDDDDAVTVTVKTIDDEESCPFRCYHKRNNNFFKSTFKLPH